MSELLIYAAALLILFLSVQMGAKSGAFTALSWMLAITVAFLVATRNWFLVTRLAATYETVSLPVLATVCFWVFFIVFLAIFIKVFETYTDRIEAVAVSFLGRVLGGLFGTVSGIVFLAALVMTGSILAPDYFPSEKPAALPVALNAMPSMAFRYLETNLARVDEKDPAHTPLPKASDTDENSTISWE